MSCSRHIHQEVVFTAFPFVRHDTMRAAAGRHPCQGSTQGPHLLVISWSHIPETIIVSDADAFKYTSNGFRNS